MATTDDVYNLLKAVNETTLGRLEREIKEFRQLLDAVNQTTLGRMEREIKDTKSLLDAVNQTTLGRMEGEIKAIQADAPGRQPFILTGTANTAGGGAVSGVANMGPVPANKRFVVESVSAQLITPASATPYILQLNGPFTLFMTPVLISGGPGGFNRYSAAHSTRFYVEASNMIQLEVKTVGGDGEALVFVSGYLLDV